MRSAVVCVVRDSETVAMKLSGHKTRSGFGRYNIVSGDDLRPAAQQPRGLTGNLACVIDAGNIDRWKLMRE